MCGFIGSHLCEHLLKNTDWNITGLDRLTYAGDLSRLAAMDCWESEKQRVHFVYHDFRAPISLGVWHHIKSGFGDVDYLIHMGAESHVDRSIADPMPFAESNVIGTVNMLQFAKDAKVPRMIYVSTDEVYGPAIGGHLHQEGEPHRPGNPYSASKAAAEDFCLAYHNTYGTPVLISNTMNNFGERQDIEKFVPRTLRALLLGQPVTIHVKKNETGEVVDVSSRCWLHARNHADALLFLLEHGEPGERYNVAGVRLDVRAIAERISKFAGVDNPKFVFEDFHSFRPGHDMHYGLDSFKMTALGWVPPVPLDESLRNTVEWYMAHTDWLQI
jgi:dTDP-glucose 4,6-dehydratase